MPHLSVEYSSNLEPNLNVAALLRVLHQAALGTGLFPVGGLRTRAVRCEQFLVADGAPEHGFVHVTLRVGAGRNEADLRRSGERIFAELTGALEPLYAARGLGVSFEIQEIGPLSFKKNNLHERLRGQP